MNRIQLVGNIGTDIRLQEFETLTQNGQQKAKASFLLAVERPVKDAAPDWVRVETWNGQARNLVRFNGKGSRIAVSGHLRGEFYNPDGSDRGGELRCVVIAEEITYLSAPRTPAETIPDAKPARAGR